jgi:hypothetical protein
VGLAGQEGWNCRVGDDPAQFDLGRWLAIYIRSLIRGHFVWRATSARADRDPRSEIGVSTRFQVVAWQRLFPAAVRQVNHKPADGAFWNDEVVPLFVIAVFHFSFPLDMYTDCTYT